MGSGGTRCTEESDDVDPQEVVEPVRDERLPVNLYQIEADYGQRRIGIPGT